MLVEVFNLSLVNLVVNILLLKVCYKKIELWILLVIYFLEYLLAAIQV